MARLTLEGHDRAPSESSVNAVGAGPALSAVSIGTRGRWPTTWRGSSRDRKPDQQIQIRPVSHPIDLVINASGGDGRRRGHDHGCDGSWTRSGGRSATRPSGPAGGGARAARVRRGARHGCGMRCPHGGEDLRPFFSTSSRPGGSASATVLRPRARAPRRRSPSRSRPDRGRTFRVYSGRGRGPRASSPAPQPTRRRGRAARSAPCSWVATRGRARRDRPLMLEDRLQRAQRGPTAAEGVERLPARHAPQMNRRVIVDLTLTRASPATACSARSTHLSPRTSWRHLDEALQAKKATGGRRRGRVAGSSASLSGGRT